MRLVAALLLLLTTAAHAADKVVPNAMAPYLASDGKGGFALSWFDSNAKAVRVATLRDGKWSETYTIPSKEPLFANRADIPTIAMNGNTLVAHYSVKNQHGRNLRLTRSTDGGKTWSTAVSPHPAVASEFGFVSLAPTGELIWLDGRDLPGGHEGAGDMTLHYSALKADGTLAKDETLDARVCDCCPTAMTMTSSGPVVAYRDRTEDEVRDISIIRRTSSGWSKPKPLHADGWKMKGCPVNGPQLDARGNDVVAAWYTMADNKPRVLVSFSRDGGATFGKPVRIDSGKGTGRVDVGFSGDQAIVTWVEENGVHARRVSPDGRLGAPSKLGTVSGVPRMAVSNQNVAVAWAAADGVHFATISLPRL